MIVSFLPLNKTTNKSDWHAHPLSPSSHKNTKNMIAYQQRKNERRTLYFALHTQRKAATSKSKAAVVSHSI